MWVKLWQCCVRDPSAVFPASDPIHDPHAACSPLGLIRDQTCPKLDRTTARLSAWTLDPRAGTLHPRTARTLPVTLAFPCTLVLRAGVPSRELVARCRMHPQPPPRIVDRSVPDALHPPSCTLHPPSHFNPRTCTLNPHTYTLNPHRRPRRRVALVGAGERGCGALT